MEFHTQFSERVRVQHVNEEPGMTKQSFKDGTDINLIIQKYDAQGVLTHLNEAAGSFADVSEISDFQDALDVVRAAEETFMQLGSRARKVFRNSPAEFLDAAHDLEKRELLVEAGLLPELPPVVVEDLPPVVPEPAPE